MRGSFGMTGKRRRMWRIAIAAALALMPLMSIPYARETSADVTTWVTSTQVIVTSTREHVDGFSLKTRRFTCPASYPHLINWKDDSVGGATYSEWASGGDGTSSDPDWVEVLFGGGLDGADVGAKIWCSSLWWPTTWDCGAEGQPDCWGAVQGYLDGTPKQGWMRAEFMFYANGNGLCDDGLMGGTDYRCYDGWFGGIRHQKEGNDWQNWALDNQRYGISGKEPINWHTTIGTHESFNTFTEGYTFPNQVYSISDQLTLGARYIDLRARWIGDYLRLSHTTGNDSTTGGSAGDRAFLYAIHEINKWLSENPGQVIRLDIGVGTGSAAAPSPAYINDPLLHYLGDKILTPYEWCSYLHTNFPDVSRPHGNYASDCNDIASFVPYRWPTTDEMRALGAQVIIFTNGGGLGQLYTFDGNVQTGNGMDGSAGYGNGFARHFDAGTCTRNGVQYLYNSDATPQQRDFYNRAFTTIEEARVFGQAPFTYDSWTGYLVADEDDIDKLVDATISPTHAEKATPMIGVVNCNVSIIKLDMLGEPGRFDGGFVGVPDITDRRDAAIWSWAPGEWGNGGGAPGNNFAMLSGADNRWHTRGKNEEYHFACAKPRSGDPTTWEDVLQETWAVTQGTGPWEMGSEMCKAEFGHLGLVFSSPRNGRANQKLIEARDAAGLAGENVWLAYSDHGIGWHAGAPPTVDATATTTDDSGTVVPYTFGDWTNHDVVINFSAINEADPLTEITDFTYTLSGATTGSGSNHSLTISNEGETTITVKAIDEEGNESPLKTFTVKIDKTDPNPIHTGPYTVDEGTTISLDGTASTDALSGVASTAWSSDEDDVFDDGDPADFYAVDGPATHTVKLRVRDVAGNETVATTSVTVLNVPPTIESIDVPERVDHATPLQVTVDATDPAGIYDPLTYLFDCDGDGDYETDTGSTNSTACLPDHTVLSPIINVLVSDDDQGVTPGSVKLYVEKFYCAHRATGALRDDADCNPAEQQVVLRPDTTTSFCVNPYTGALTYGSRGCSGNLVTLSLPAPTALTACENPYTGQLTYRQTQRCVSNEIPRLIPAR